MKIKYLKDKKGPGNPYEFPNHVKEGIKRGQEQGRRGLTKSTDEVMKKYKKMRTFLIFFSLLLIFNGALGQGFGKLSTNDSIKLVDTWIKFKKALENKDLKTLKTISLRVVNCDIFQTPDPNHDVSPLISIDTFAKQFFRNVNNSKL